MARVVVCDDELCLFSGGRESCGTTGPASELDRELEKLMELFSTDEAITFPAFADAFEVPPADPIENSKGFHTVQRLESISDNFSEPTDDELQQHDVQSTSASHEESSIAESDDNNPEKRSRVLLPTPRIMKNDIRRYYSRMFMNTINSGDFGNIQNFFNTFMPWPCKFVADQDLSPELKVPPRIIADGPRLMAHYLLGCFVQYPDMVLTMHSCEIVTSRNHPGTRIVMDMGVRSTKIYDLDMTDWVPQLALLDATYQKAVCDAAAAKETATTIASTPVTGVSDDPVAASSTSAAGTVPGQAVVVAKRPRGRPRNSQMNNSHLVTQGQIAVAGTVGSKRKKVPCNNNTGCSNTATVGDSAAVDTDATVSDATSVDDSTVVSATTPGQFINSHIPAAFVHSLFQHAQLLPTPLKLMLRGTVTLYLDEHNLMQHVNLNMEQMNK